MQLHLNQIKENVIDTFATATESGILPATKSKIRSFASLLEIVNFVDTALGFDDRADSWEFVMDACHATGPLADIEEWVRRTQCGHRNLRIEILYPIEGGTLIIEDVVGELDIRLLLESDGTIRCKATGDILGKNAADTIRTLKIDRWFDV